MQSLVADKERTGFTQNRGKQVHDARCPEELRCPWGSRAVLVVLDAFLPSA